MTTPGSGAGRRGGFLSGLSAALTPPVVVDDDPDKPLQRPKTVNIAAVLVVLAGVLFCYAGIASLSYLDTGLKAAVVQYNDEVARCTTEFGGIDKAAKEPANATDEQKKRVQLCNDYKPLQQSMIDAAKSRATLIAWAEIVLGVVAIAVGWFLRSGAAWARRAAVGIVLVTMLLTMFFPGVSTLVTMGITLCLVAAVLLCYLGSGGVFFQRAALRRRSA